MDHNPSGRRPHYHRGRRGTDRRGGDRRPAQQTSEQGARPSGEHVDVEQIMREIRSRISERHNIDLSPQQIQDLAARRLEAILDPRNINPTLLEQLRKGAAAVPAPAPVIADDGSIDDDSIYASPRSALRFFRRLLKPLLKLFFDPAPLTRALRTQAGINREAAARSAELAQRQTEWNALHYQILQRLVTEVSRASIELQALTTRIESLSARIDFNDRRVRTLEHAAPSSSNRGQRLPEPPPAPAAALVTPGNDAVQSQTVAPPTAAPGADAPRRKRRRRRGRRGPAAPFESMGGPTATAGVDTPGEAADLDDGDDSDGGTPDAPAISTEAPADHGEAPVSEPSSEPPPPSTLSPATESAAFTALTPSDESASAVPAPSPDPGPSER